MRVSTCLGRRGSGVQIAPPRPIESVAYGHLGRPLKTAVDEFVAVVSLKIHLLNTLGSAPVIPPQWRNDRGPSLKFNRETDPLVPKAAKGVFFTPMVSATSPMLSIRWREIIVALNVPEYPWFSSGVPKEIPLVKRHQSSVFRVA